ncbi:MAG: hypothetical protein K2O52_07290 [Oscillospiraceae bacterium]|nr:hypothetical protein [Oscillospiraceae bacterium]
MCRNQKESEVKCVKNKIGSEIIKAVLETSVKENLTENVKIDYSPDANNYRISIWKKGVSAGTIIRTKKQGIGKWNHMIKSFEKYCHDLKKSVNTMDSTAHVTLLVLNDMNLSQTLLTITHYNFMLDKKHRKLC